VRTGLDGRLLSLPGSDWVETGDLGFIDQQGFVSIVGRAADVIDAGGEHVVAAEVEDALMARPDIAEAGVAGIANSLDVEELWAAVVARRPIDARDVLDQARATLGPIRTPRVLRMVDALPRNALGKLVRGELARSLPHTGSLAVTDLGGVAVHFLPQFDGGGQSYGQSFVPYVKDRFGRVPRLLEWCCGPGFIGFSLLGHGLCDRLGLADIHPAVIDLCRTTIDRNGLESRSAAYVSDCFDAIPPDVRWDLVVANPPHWLSHAELRRRETAVAAARGGQVERAERSPLIYLDPMWHTHRKFFAQVGDRLTEGGSAVLVEHRDGSSAESFADMVREAGLELVAADPLDDGSPFYFLWVRRPGR
jgi:hypothetical protein